MPLTAGDKLGPYEILGSIGKGGMGEVYRARDARLGREVAVKVSAERFGERFEREARVISSLNHPNICTLYDVGPNYLVMELIEGPTLAERIKEGAIPLEEALSIARQIADGLEAAHENGITHRDLKPGNVKVKPDGSVKVLDFGLAKVGPRRSASDGDNPELSPTLSMAATQAGVILGTAAYMAPEQARGKAVDKRADIWAFGVVLYEMVTGKRLFQGEDLTDTLASVVKIEPDISDAPPELQRLLTKCLQKDPKKRLRDISGVELLLEQRGTVNPLQTKGLVRKMPWVVAAVCALAAFAALTFRVRSSASGTASVMSANLIMDLTPAEMLGPAGFRNRSSRTSFTVSPDGSTVIFVGVRDRTSMLYRRPFSEAAAVAIPGTEGADYPFFSPDGQWVGFAAANKLKKVALGGGPPIDLCDLTGRIWGASWGSTGVIVFANAGLWTVPDSGGKPAILVERTQGIVVSPAMLPDGQSVLFTERPSISWEEAHVDSIRLATKERKTLLTNAADARYSPTGHLVFIRNAALLAVAFDATRAEISGSPVPLLAGVMQATNAGNGNDETGMGQFVLSGSGMLIYASGGIYPTPATGLVRVDRKGKETKLADIQGALFGVRLSPDRSRVAALKTQNGTRASDLWVYELPSGTPTRLTSTGGASWPLFSPDGKSIAYTESGSNPGIYLLPTDGSGASTRITEPAKNAAGFSPPASWSPDGKWLAYLQSVGNVYQLFVRPMPGPGESKQFAPSTFTMTHAEFSPDGRWMAYVSNESGASEVYVQAFPGAGEKHRVSSSGGSQPAWSRNGGELFYFQPKGIAPNTTTAIVAAEISNAGGFRVGAQYVLFDGSYIGSTPLRSYDLTSDGQFIMVRQEGNPPDQRITQLNVVLGWGQDLKRRVPSSTPAR
jgi:eukaryotic-like serine/threonine-protein kinase